MTILKTSPNGQLRLRQLGEKNGVVEILGSDGKWSWCVWRSRPLDQAQNLFDSQLKFHQAVEG